MPIFNLQSVRQVRAPDGTVSYAPAPEELIRRGPVVQVSVGLAEPLVTQLLQKGLSLPTPAAGLALIDTGAAMTCIDETVAQQIGLPVVDVGTLGSASHAATPVNIYPALIEFVGVTFRVNALRAFGANISPLGYVAIIGRDLLQACVLVYNGQTGLVTLAV